MHQIMNISMHFFWQKTSLERGRTDEIISSDQIYRLYLESEQNMQVPLSLPTVIDY